MLLKIRHALVEITNHPHVKQSAIIINNEIIITSGCILQPYLQPNNDDANCVSTKILERLQLGQLVNAQDEHSAEAQLLQQLSYQVTFDRRKLPVTDRKQTHILTRYRARPLHLFASSSIARNIYRFVPPTPADMQRHYTEVLLSTFVVLSLKTSGERENFERFLLHVGHYLRYLYPIQCLDDVLAMCTPFGLENFYKTISIGKVSNVLGRDSCLFTVSNALPTGCEGSAVFNNKLRLIGIIICTSFKVNEQNVNITMVANFAHLLRDFMRQLGINTTSITVPREPSTFPWERTMVVIEANGSQGTGTFVKVQNKKFILTCSHVIFKINAKVWCRSVDGQFESDVLWRNPHYDRAFDVALLAAPHDTPERYCVRLSAAKPSLGQTVYNAGFPYFVNFNLKYDFNPSIFQGRIIKCAPGAIMSDGCVQAGQSGGPMFDQNGCLLGICVSNMKREKVIYPNINTAVPIHDIRDTLRDFAKTNDLSVLNNLVANTDVQRTWSLEIPPILSKL